MSIKDWREKIKLPWEVVKERLGGEVAGERFFTAAVIILVGFSSFGLGRLSVTEEKREPILIERNEEKQKVSLISGALLPQTQTASVAGSLKDTTPPASAAEAGGKLVASKNGAKYYFPWCGGAARIAEQNKIWFNSETEARSKGYAPAANCKGLK